MQDKIKKISLRLVIYLYFFITLYFIIANSMAGIKLDKYTAMVLFFIIAIVYLFRIHIRKITKSIYNNTKILKALLVLAILIGLALRLSFLFYEYNPAGDPQTFYNTAIAMNESSGKLISGSDIDINKGGLNAEEYYAIHPFLFVYTKLLSIAMEVFGGGYFAVLALNILFDALGGFLIYALLKRIAGDKRVAIAGAILWSLSPFNILFCGLSLPVVAVNSLIILCFLLSYLLIKNRKDVGKFLLLSLALGVAIAVTNTLRPIMAVYIIAITLAIAHQLLSRQIRLWVALSGILVILVPYFGVNKLHDYILTKYTGFETSIADSGGWNIFVGSNYDSTGRWNRADNDLKGEIFKKVRSVEAAQLEYRNRGIDRWKERGVRQNIVFLFDKSIVLAGEQPSSVYNVDSIINFWPSKYTGGILTLFFALIIIMNLLFTRNLLYINRKEISIVHIMMLFVVGVLLAQLLVEVSPRYFLPILPAMIILGSLSLLKKSEIKKRLG